MYALFVLYGCTIPFRFAGGIEEAIQKLHQLPIAPWIDPETGRRPSFPDTVQNILLFLPFGALGLIAGRNRGLPRMLLVTGLGAGLSALVECAQLFTIDRVSSVSDLATNTVGTFAGATAAAAASGAATRIFRQAQKSNWARVAELQPLIVASLVVLVTIWQPFDVTLDVSSVKNKLKSFIADPVQFTGIRDEGLTFLVVSLFATLLAAFLSAARVAKPAIVAAVTGVTLCVVLEGVQILISSRMPGAWDVAVGAAGAIAGAAFWSGGGTQRLATLWLTVVCLTAVAAVCLMLSPFEFTAAYHSVGWFPMYGYYSRTTFETLSHVLEQLLLYFPLGFLVAYPARPTGTLVLLAAVVTLAIAGPVEYLQGWVAGRFPDVSDVGVAVLGAGLGAWIARIGVADVPATIEREFGR